MSQAYHSVLLMADAREKYSEFCIPMVVIPATISNNVPGTDFSLGTDTAVNEITEVSKSMNTDGVDNKVTDVSTCECHLFLAFTLHFDNLGLEVICA